MTQEQLQAQLGLQHLDLLAQRRLGHAQLGRRAGDVAGVGHGQEVPQAPNVHSLIISSVCYSDI